MEVDLRATAVGFVAALLVLAILLAVVGVGRVLTALSQADLGVLAGVVAVAALWLSAWGLSLRTVLGVIGVPVTKRVAVLVFAAATFANNVTPFGQAGGEPIAALLIAKATGVEYESSLAAIASVDSLNFVPSIALATVGIGFYSTQFAFGRRLRFAALAVGALAVAVPVAAFLLWRNRYRVERRLVGVVLPVARLLGRIVPRKSPPARADIEARIEGFFGAIERVATDTDQLALALGFSTVGWLCLAGSLWLSLFAIGEAVSFAAILVVVPIGAIAGITPLPGGLGGVETVLIFLLVSPLVGIPAGVATAGVIVHRSATYWLPTVVGGGVAGIIGSRTVREGTQAGP
jgi:uncharacterized protein (TIRG00374 family)